MKPEEHQSIAHIVALAPSVAPEPNFFQKIFISISNCRFFLILRGFPRLFNKPKFQKRGDFLKYH